MANDKHFAYSQQVELPDDLKTLQYHNFHIRPHWNHPNHPHSTEAAVEEKIARLDLTEPVYLIDDQTALKIDGDTLEVVSEGEWKVYN